MNHSCPRLGWQWTMYMYKHLNRLWNRNVYLIYLRNSLHCIWLQLCEQYTFSIIYFQYIFYSIEPIINWFQFKCTFFVYFFPTIKIYLFLIYIFIIDGSVDHFDSNELGLENNAKHFSKMTSLLHVYHSRLGSSI